MLIVCPSCQTSYEVSAASLGAEGRSVRCVRCKEVWFATPAQEESGQPAAPAAEAAAMSAATASAQYRRGAGPSAPGTADDRWGQGDHADQADQAGQPAGDDWSVDANLAARAADRSAVRFEEAPMPDAGAAAAGLDAAYDAPPLAPAVDEPSASDEPSEDIESFAARRARRERLRNQRRSGRPSLATVLFALFAANAALIGWRTDVVRLMPQTASLFAAIGLPVNLRGLAFSDITTTTEAHDGVTMLLVQGTITNISKQPRDVPRIRLAMKNAAGAEVYSWTSLPTRSALAPGDSEPFQTQLASPPPEGNAVEVRFFLKRDLARGGR
jgi:predicted Zn finger-like uncharacterized protein